LPFLLLVIFAVALFKNSRLIHLLQFF